MAFTDGWEKGEAKAEAVNVGQVVLIAKIANIVEQILSEDEIEELVEILSRGLPTAFIDE